MRRNFKIYFILFISALFLFFCIPKEWSYFGEYGGIYNPILKYGKYIIAGTEYSKILIISAKDSSNVKTLDLNIGNISPQFVSNGFVYVLSEDKLWKINVKNLEKKWTFSPSDGFGLEKSYLKNGLVYVTSKNGILYALNNTTGEIKWHIKTKNVEYLSEITSANVIYNAPDFFFNKGLYLVDRSGFINRIDPIKGTVIWTTKLSGSVLGSSSWDQDNIFIADSKNYITSVAKKDGKKTWEKEIDKITCSGVVGQSLIAVDETGEITKLDKKTGREIWKSKSSVGSVNCPSYISKDLVFTTTDGLVFKVDFNNGEVLWKNNDFGKISLAPKIVDSLSKDYVIADLKGNVSRINIKGEKKWTFETRSPVYSELQIFFNTLYVANSTGNLYKISLQTGRVLTTDIFGSFNVSLDKNIVGANEIHEIKLVSKSEFYNPWTEAFISGSFTHESGKTVQIYGFYYDENEWRIRFNPPLVGRWNFVINWVDRGKVFKYSGSLFSNTNTDKSYIRQASNNKKWLTTDGAKIFNGVGIQETIYDYNRNGSGLDDWAIGSTHMESTQSGVLNIVKSDKVISLKDYIETYGPNGAGMNIYRYSIMNGNNSLYRDLKNPIVFSIRDGKIADELLSTLRSNNIHVWLTFFHFYVPFSNTFNESDKALLSEYIRYVIARYGAYVDIWEMVNEYQAPQEVKNFIASEIEKYDFEDRLVTISPEDKEDKNIDIISPHWYESEIAEVSDKVVSDYVNTFADSDKPVVFGEQGNATHNWDRMSALRMRVRIWTSFFNQAYIIFWNMSDKIGVKQTYPLFANIYLGEEERKYIKNFINFTNDLDINLTKTKIDINSGGVRGYGLQTQESFVGYIYHYLDPRRLTIANISLKLPFAGTLVWYDPSTGNHIKDDYCNAYCVVNTPQFLSDIAFKLVR